MTRGLMRFDLCAAAIRRFVVLRERFLSLASLGACALPQPSDGADARPNLVVIVSDDHRADHLGYFNHPEIQTPNLDALARRGTVLREAYVLAAEQGSVCMPARTQLHSGRSLYQWSPNTTIDGVYQKRPAETDPAGWCLGRAFREAGYATLRSGKTANVPTPLNNEFETNIEETGTLMSHFNAGLDFIRAQAGVKPFLLVLEPRVPHAPYEGWDIAPWSALYRDGTNELAAPNISLPPEYLTQHPFMHTRVHEWGPSKGLPHDKSPWTPEAAKEELARYYSSISYLDHAVGLILAELQQKGVLDNTYVIFFGDNGYSISHHGLFEKSDVYQHGGLHVPMLVAGPGIAHRETSAVVYLSDVFPTLCELTGVAIPSRLTGRSFVPVLRGNEENARKVVFSDFKNEQLSVRDGRWKLIRWTEASAWPGTVQLFDLETDPRELNDLSADPAQAQRIADLTALIDSERAAQGAIWPLPINPVPRGRL